MKGPKREKKIGGDDDYGDEEDYEKICSFGYSLLILLLLLSILS